MLTCTRRLTFCAGHRVYGHENKCANLHGHNYVVEIDAEGGLDHVGRVIDFAVLKDRVGGFLESQWDHGFLFWEGDETLLCHFRGSGFKYQELTFNPTAENIATHLLRVVCPQVLADTGVNVRRVRVMETENCWAADEL